MRANLNPNLSEIRASVYIPLLSFIKYGDTGAALSRRERERIMYFQVSRDAMVLLVSVRGEVKSQSHGLKYHYYARSRYYRGPAIDRPAAKRMRLSRLKITRDTRYP